MKITSRDNQRLKDVRKVRDGLIGDSIFVEGVRLVEECLRSDLPIKEVIYSENFLRNDRARIILNQLERNNLNPIETSDKIFNSISDTKSSQGLILIAEKPATGQEIIESKLSRVSKSSPLILLLHETNNPSNLGAVLRTAEAAGIDGIILTKTSADPFTPKALRASMGAGFRLSIWENSDFFEVLNWARSRNLKPICADINSATSYIEIDWKKPRLLVFGSEANGLSAKEKSEIEESLIIPMENDVESLNLAVSCGIILYEAKRQRFKVTT